jgi:membrane-bound lytic murein transglycosylase D
VPQGRTFYYRVNRGDTLAGIATRYDVSVQDLKRWNGLSGNAVAAGQRLRITSDLAPNAATAKRATGKAPPPAQARTATKTQRPAKTQASTKAPQGKSAAKAGTKSTAKAKGASRSVVAGNLSGG